MISMVRCSLHGSESEFGNYKIMPSFLSIRTTTWLSYRARSLPILSLLELAGLLLQLRTELPPRRAFAPPPPSLCHPVVRFGAGAGAGAARIESDKHNHKVGFDQDIFTGQYKMLTGLPETLAYPSGYSYTTGSS